VLDGHAQWHHLATWVGDVAPSQITLGNLVYERFEVLSCNSMMAL